jgi:enterochelin esterase-like enzyme
VPRSFEGTLESEAMGKPMAFSVYTPPDFSKDEQLPLVVLLHGAGGDHLDFDRYELDQHFNKAYAKGVLPRVVVTMPDGELGFWENWADGSRLYRDWVMRELLPYVQREFNTASCPESCHVMGVSMGGHGALRFSYYEADSFSTVTVISAPILSHDDAREQFGGLIGWLIPYQRIWGDIDDPNALPRAVDPFVGWIENDALRQKKLFLAWGTGDSTQIKASNELFSNRLKESGLQFTTEIYDGDHKWVDWKFVIERAVQQNAAPGSD